MKKTAKRVMALLLIFLLSFSGVQIWAEGTEAEFYIEQKEEDVQQFSFDNGSRLPVSGVRYDKFRRWDDGPSTRDYPNLGVGIKYI